MKEDVFGNSSCSCSWLCYFSRIQTTSIQIMSFKSVQEKISNKFFGQRACCWSSRVKRGAKWSDISSVGLWERSSRLTGLASLLEQYMVHGRKNPITSDEVSLHPSATWLLNTTRVFPIAIYTLDSSTINMFIRCQFLGG